MHRIPTLDPAPVSGLVRALISVALLAVAACSTAPSSSSAPDDTDASERPPATARPERPQAPAPLPAPEKAPVPAEPAPTPPSEATAPDRPDAVESDPAPITAPIAATIAATSPAPEPSADTGDRYPDPDPSDESDSNPDSNPDSKADRGIAPRPGPAAAEVVLSGRVRLDVSQVEDVDDDSVADTVIYFQPAGASVTAAPRDFAITTRRKRLIPDVLVVPVGSTVSFPNEDDILHNVFSVSSAASFDLGLYGQGQSKSHTFIEPGLAVIHCNVHHAMRADVLVVDTPFYAQADREGRFSMKGIAPTTGELVAWHPRAGFVRRAVTFPVEESLELELTLVRPRIPDHLDKTGQPYRPERPRGR